MIIGIVKIRAAYLYMRAQVDCYVMSWSVPRVYALNPAVHGISEFDADPGTVLIFRGFLMFQASNG